MTELPAVRLADLRERVLEASQHARAAGRSYPDVADISPAEAFSRAADAFYGMLCALRDDAWHLPVVNQFDVQGLVGHLIGVELDVHRSIAGDPDVRDLDHVESTRSTAATHAGQRPEQTRTEWRRAIEETQALVESASSLDVEVPVHGLRTSLGTLLVIRAFELWTHENDIRRVAGLPPSVPDGPTLRLMTSVAAQALPVGAGRVGLDDPTRVRLVLTGVGGGTWDISFGAGSDDDAVSVRIVADAVAFCRLAANRVTPAELDLDVSGDTDRAGRVLAAVSALALD